MEYTRTAQPAPSMGGAGVRFTNSRVQQPQKDFADELLEQARAELARQAAQEPERDRSGPGMEQDRDRERSRERGGREL